MPTMSNCDKESFNIESFNTECPICFSEDGNMIILSCLHRFHEDCLQGHTNLDCPKCRQHVVNWPPILKEKIIKNSKEFTSELDEEDRRNLIEQQLNENRQFLSQMTMFLQPPPQLEVATALNFLREHGIPMRYLPRKIRIVVKKGQPRLQPGILFNGIVSQIFEQIQEDIYHGDLNVEVSNSEESLFDEEGELSDDSYDDEEDPFLEENEELEELDFNCNVVEKE